jgi:hypothetical protein
VTRQEGGRGDKGGGGGRHHGKNLNGGGKSPKRNVILELLNGQGPQAFFDLLKGTRIATQAQKEKKQLAQKWACTSRCECQKAAKEVVTGHLPK